MRRDTLWGKPEKPIYQAPQKALGQAYDYETVKKAQTALYAKGINSYLVTTSLKADGTFDGVWGPGTESAVIKFQQGRGLPATGVLDTATLSALGITVTPPVYPPVIPPGVPTPTDLKGWLAKYGLWVGAGVLGLIGIFLLIGKGEK